MKIGETEEADEKLKLRKVCKESWNNVSNVSDKGGVNEEGDEENEPLSALQKIWTKESKDGSETEMASNCDNPTLTEYRKCLYCSRVLPNSSSMADHLMTRHSDKSLPCNKCDKSSLYKGGNEEQNDGNVANGIAESLKSRSKQSAGKSQNPKKNHPCDLCESSFTLKNQLMKHQNQEHGADIRCDICSLTFTSMVSLRSHKFTKHTGKDKICEICGYSTKKTYDFKRHQVKHSNVYAIKCTVCNKGFYSQYDFNEHKNVHTAERPYQCEVCGVDYSRRSSLILHRNRKHPETYDLSKRCHICNQVCLTKETMAAHIKTHVEGRKKFYCDICGKGLLTRVILKIHRRIHTGEKPFDCSYCGRAFSCKKNLSVHIRLHTGDRPYSCKFCWKAYTKSSALKAHEKSHSNHHQVIPLYLPIVTIKVEPTSEEEPEPEKTRESHPGEKGENSPDHGEKIPCELCGESFDRKLLARHKRRHVNARKTHNCPDCEKSFTVMTKLVTHQKESHGTAMTCTRCDKRFERLPTYASHMKKHEKEKSFVCDVCGFATIEKLTLDNHKLVRHQIGKFPLECSLCKKGFLSKYALNNHMNRHTGATPHQCHKCGSAYSSLKSLERHSYKCTPDLFKNKIFPCPFCRRLFKSRKKLELHEKSKHADGKRNVCDFCGKDFSFRESLIRHKRIHTGEKPKECTVCNKRFGCSTYLRSHMRTHTGEKPYQCRFCWKKFSQRSSMVTHEKSHLKNLASSGIEIIPVVTESN